MCVVIFRKRSRRGGSSLSGTIAILPVGAMGYMRFWGGFVGGLVLATLYGSYCGNKWLINAGLVFGLVEKRARDSSHL